MNSNVLQFRNSSALSSMNSKVTLSKNRSVQQLMNNNATLFRNDNVRLLQILSMSKSALPLTSRGV